MVFQDNFLFSGTIRENIQFGKKDATDEEIDKALKSASAYDFVYDKEEMGYSNDSLSTGVIVIDYDWISKETADSIFDGFNDLCYYMPSLYAIQYSSSYFINPKKNGLHIYIKTGILNKYEFEFQATLAIHYLAALINKFLGIDLRKENENEKVIDTHNCKMSQRVNLFYSPFWYNRYAVEFNPS